MQLEGVYSVLPTPFSASGDLDLASLRQVIDLFIDAPGTDMWLYAYPPPAFLRAQGPLMEPTDSVVRTDLMPSPQATAQSRAARRAPPRR